MKDFQVGTDIYVIPRGFYAVVSSVFYYEHVKDYLNFADSLDFDYPLWKIKPIYLVIAYTGEYASEFFIAISDVVTLSSELN